MKRMIWLGSGWVFTGLGTLGVAVPLLPTAPFLLLALWAFFKSSPRRARRLLRHPRYGPILRAWIRHGAIPRPAKRLATGLLALSWIILWLGNTRWEVLVALGLFFSAVAAFVWTRPEDDARK